MRAREHVLVGDRSIDVRLGREVHHGVAALHRLARRAWILDRALDEHDPVLHLRQVLAPAGVGELVEHHDLVVRARLEHHPHVCRADETGGAGDQQLHAATERSAR